MSPDLDVAINFLEHLRPSWTLTALVPERGKPETTRTFTSPDPAREFIAQQNTNKGLYYSVNPTRAADRKSGKKDIIKIEYVFADLDPKDDETPEAAKARYLAKLETIPKPTAVVDSGNGLQALWKLETALDPEQREAAEACSKAIMELLGGKAGTQNIDRLLRLPGTVNWPNDTKKSKGRLPCMSQLIQLNGARYPFEQLCALGGTEPNRAGTPGDGGHHEQQTALPPALVAMLHLPNKTPCGAYETRSEALFALLTGALRQRVAEEAIIAACLDSRYTGNGIYTHIQDNHGKKYLKEQIEHARERVLKDKKPRTPTLTELITGAKLFHTSDHRGYANITNGGHRETWPIRSKNFRLWLSRSWFQKTGKPPSRDALNSNLDQIEAKALFDGPLHSAFVRVGAAQGKLYLDLCDDKWRAVEIDATGWRVITNPPIYFRRTPGMEPLPVPLTGGSIDLLRPFLNLPEDEDDGFVLTIAWLLAAFREHGPYPLLVLSGEQGTAKTFFCRLMRMLIDPNSTPNRTLPREERDLYIAANNSHVVAFDNVSGMPYWISDALCRLSTGGGLGVRQLYTDEDETLFNLTRPIILNGIEDNMTRPDLADRAITLILELIPEEERRAEKDLLAEFERARPQILGALLTLVATGLRNLPDTKLDKLPRMADFALWIEACEPWECGTFEKAYTTNRDNMVETVMEAIPLSDALRSLIIERGEWKSGAADLLKELNRRDAQDGIRRDRRHWPQTPKDLSGGVTRVKPLLRSLGFTVTVGRKGSGERFVELNSNRPAQPRTEPHF